MPRFTREELDCLQAGHEVKKGKYTYRIHGKYIEDSWHWVLQKIKKTDEDWEDYKII
nr:MAG TPA: hypothetical protein [Microviridae sp.]